MINVSARTLKALAALTWYTGGIVLVLKARSLLGEAEHIEPGRIWPWIAAISGVTIGILKARFIFRKSCRKNLKRIDALEKRRIWLFFRPWFFFLLFLMILTGATLSRAAHGNYILLIAVAILDFSIGVALLGSSYVFWKDRVFVKD